MLEGLAIPKKQFSCKVRTLKQGLSKEDAQILDDAVMNPDWMYKTLSNELAKRNVQIGDVALKAHREKHCSCWKI